MGRTGQEKQTVGTVQVTAIRPASNFSTSINLTDEWAGPLACLFLLTILSVDKVDFVPFTSYSQEGDCSTK